MANFASKAEEYSAIREIPSGKFCSERNRPKTDHHAKKYISVVGDSGGVESRILHRRTNLEERFGAL